MENDNNNGGQGTGGNDLSNSDFGGNDLSSSSGTDYAANDIGSFESSVTSSYDGGITATETHDTSSPSTGYSNDPAGSALAGAAEQSTESSPGPGGPAMGSLDTTVGAPTISANTNQPGAPEFSGAFSSAASIAAAALGIAAASRGMWGTAATAVATNNPGIQRGAETLANTLNSAVMKGTEEAVKNSPDGFFGFGADMSTQDFSAPSPAAAPPASPDPMFPPAIVQENTNLLSQLGFVYN